MNLVPSQPGGCVGADLRIIACYLPVALQAPCIPDELCARVYDFCKRLLTLPKPFCTIGLDYASRLQVERTAPGKGVPCLAQPGTGKGWALKG